MNSTAEDRPAAYFNTGKGQTWRLKYMI